MDIKDITEQDLFKLPITQAIKAEVEDHFTDYLFYKNDGKEALFQCTRCGCSDRIEKNFKHKEVINCPVCCEEVITYRAGYGRKYLYEKRSFGICYNLSGSLAIRIVTVHKNFPSTPIEWYYENIMPEYDYNDDYIYIFSGKKAVRFINHPKLIDNKWVRNYKKASRFTLLPQYWRLNTPTHYDTAVLINTNAIKNTCLRYSEVSEIAENVNEALRYLKFFQKHPNVEYLIKQDFLQIVFDCVIYDDAAEKIEWKSNNLLHMLGISKTDIDFCKEMRICDLEFYKAVLKTDPKNAKDIYLYFKTYDAFTDILNIRKITPSFTFEKIRNYILKQQKNNGGSINHIIRTWLDYLRMGDDREILEEITPKNIYDAHDRMNEKCKYLASVKENKKISGRVESLKPLIFNFENLIMKIPESGQEIINEGKILQHCVGGYVRRHADGSTTILFIRHKDNPGKPFFTIEIDNDLKIVQCHGFRNERGSAKPQEILDFEVNYKKYLTEVKQNGKLNNKRTGS